MTPLRNGEVVAGRYRLEESLGSGTASTTWRALDTTLGRRVALRFVEHVDPQAMMRHAAAAASLTHPGVVRIFDTGSTEGRFFTVCELLKGSLADGPAPQDPSQALHTSLQLAGGLAHAHMRGMAHGALLPNNVLVGDQGAKIADFALSARHLNGTAATMAGDLRDLGALILYMLRSCPDAAGGRALAGVAQDLRSGAYGRAQDVVDDLQRLAAPASRRRLNRRWMAATAIAAIVLGSVGIGRLSTPGEPGAESAPATLAEAVPIASVQDFDPQGDQTEGRRTVERIYDGDVTTFWSTEHYRQGPGFTAPKTGVGVIFDLGSEQLLGGVRVHLAVPGCSWELRYSTIRSYRIEDWPAVSSVAEASVVAESTFPATRSRWWLLWVTALTRGVPGAGDDWACGVADVSLYRP